MLRVHSIETFGAHEGPGIRLVIFTQGCHFKCIYCHNPDTIPCTGGEMMSYNYLLDLVKKEIPYFVRGGGVTISGGEPLIHAKELIPFFQELKKLGVHTAIDTNGSIFNEDVEKLLEYTDLLLPDIKQINNKKHKDITTRSNENSLKFIRHLEEIGKKFWIRYVLVPGYTNSKKDLESLGEFISGFKNMERIEILPYHTLGRYKRISLGRDYRLEGIKVPTQKQIESAVQILKNYTPNVYIRG